MPLAASPIDSSHPSCPTYKVVDASVVATAAAVTSDVVDCTAFASGMLYVAATGGPVTITAYARFDEGSQFMLVPHLDSTGPNPYTSAAAASSTARRVDLSGARYVNLVVYNGNAGNVTVNAWISLQGDS